MRHTYIPYRYRKKNRGAILILMLVLAAFTSLLATSNLDRTRQRTLLDSALATRAQTDEILKQSLGEGIAYAVNHLRKEDFDIGKRGIYKTVDAERLKSDYRRFAYSSQSSVGGADSGFWLEMFSENDVMQTAQAKFYLSCRLLISAYATRADSPLLFSQALLETALPMLVAPTTDTNVIKVETLPEAKVIAIRTFN